MNLHPSFSTALQTMMCEEGPIRGLNAVTASAGPASIKIGNCRHRDRVK